MNSKSLFALIFALAFALFLLTVNTVYNHKSIYREEKGYRCNQKTLNGTFVENIITPYDIKHNKINNEYLKKYYSYIYKQSGDYDVYLDKAFRFIDDLNSTYNTDLQLSNMTFQNNFSNEINDFPLQSFDDFYTRLESLFKLRICFSYYSEPNNNDNFTLYIANYRQYKYHINLMSKTLSRFIELNAIIGIKLSLIENIELIPEKIAPIVENIRKNIRNHVKLHNEIALIDIHGRNSTYIYTKNDYMNKVVANTLEAYKIISFNGTHESTFYKSTLLENSFVKIEIINKELGIANPCLPMRNLLNNFKKSSSYDLLNKIKLIDLSMMKYYKNHTLLESKKTLLYDIIFFTLDILEYRAITSDNSKINYAQIISDNNFEVNKMWPILSKNENDFLSQNDADYFSLYNMILNDFLKNFGKVLNIRIGYDTDTNNISFFLGMEEY